MTTSSPLPPTWPRCRPSMVRSRPPSLLCKTSVPLKVRRWPGANSIHPSPFHSPTRKSSFFIASRWGAVGGCAWLKLALPDTTTAAMKESRLDIAGIPVVDRHLPDDEASAEGGGPPDAVLAPLVPGGDGDGPAGAEHPVLRFLGARRVEKGLQPSGHL